MSSHPFWYESSQVPTTGFQPVVLSTRVRMARNISGLPFPNRMSLEEYISLRTSVFRVLQKYRYLECKSAQGANVRTDDFLVSVEAADKGISTFGRPETGQVIVIGDEDHFRISTVTAGLSLDTAMDLTSDMETLLANDFPFAFDKQRFGFLTASMANAGLAMRVSVWMHVPGLILSETWAELEPLLKSMDISVRGILGEESELTAGMVQLSNRTSYGKSSDEILAKLKRVIDLVNESERSALSDLLRQYKSKTIDYLKWMSLLEQPFISRDAFIHAVSAALLAARLGYNVRFDNQLALRVLIAGFKSRHEDGLIQMQVVRNLLKDTLMDT
jgi:protein arginine kinase